MVSRWIFGHLIALVGTFVTGVIGIWLTIVYMQDFKYAKSFSVDPDIGNNFNTVFYGCISLVNLAFFMFFFAGLFN